ncbi:MAG: PHB depolymerase family esterase, partial [Bacteroidota bacterium]
MRMLTTKRMDSILMPFMIWLMLGMLLPSCTQEPPTSHPTYPQEAGLHTLTLRSGNLDREFLLYIPDGYDENTSLPVMLNFHGYGGQASDHLAYTDMRPIADTANFLLVYPQGSLLGMDPHWNAGLDTDQNKSDVDDFGFVENLIESLEANYPVDAERVYACGYSNGSFLSYSLAC